MAIKVIICAKTALRLHKMDVFKYKRNSIKKVLWILLFLTCAANVKSLKAQQINTSSYLLKVQDSTGDKYGYVNTKGDPIIPFGKYMICYTDTFRTYAIVAIVGAGFAAIDRNENVMYEVFSFDNGPDEPSEGLFRIKQSGKIGYANASDGSVVIKPNYLGAWPFENGQAKVSFDCVEKLHGEHHFWDGGSWFFIDRSGNVIDAAKEK